MSTARKDEGYYTYADTLEWNENFRAEVIGGEIFMMAPPGTIHQDIIGEFFVFLHGFLKGKTCRAYIAPFGVRLFPKQDLSDDTLVEPDIAVVYDRAKIDKRGCNGAPDMIVEILSPSSARYDQIVKFRLYQKAGVREYWIVDGENRVVHVHTLSDESYVTAVYGEDDKVPVSVLPGCMIPLKEVFTQGE